MLDAGNNFSIGPGPGPYRRSGRKEQGPALQGTLLRKWLSVLASLTEGFSADVQPQRPTRRMVLRERASGPLLSFTFQSCCLCPTLYKIQFGKGKWVC